MPPVGSDSPKTKFRHGREREDSNEETFPIASTLPISIQPPNIPDLILPSVLENSSALTPQVVHAATLTVLDLGRDDQSIARLPDSIAASSITTRTVTTLEPNRSSSDQPAPTVSSRPTESLAEFTASSSTPADEATSSAVEATADILPTSLSAGPSRIEPASAGPI